jgi:N,N-dimethylformamidase
MLKSRHPLPAIIGYVTPLSAKAGELLQFKISPAGNRDLAANIFQLDCCSPNPTGPGPKSERVDFGLERRYQAEQKAYLGSRAIGLRKFLEAPQ